MNLLTVIAGSLFGTFLIHRYASASKADQATFTASKPANLSRFVAIRTTLGSWRTVAGQLPGTFWDSVAAFCKAISGEVELTIGEWCETCQDVHAVGVACPRQMLGQCAECVDVVTLTPAGNCPESMYHVVCNRSAKKVAA